MDIKDTLKKILKKIKLGVPKRILFFLAAAASFLYAGVRYKLIERKYLNESKLDIAEDTSS